MKPSICEICQTFNLGKCHDYFKKTSTSRISQFAVVVKYVGKLQNGEICLNPSIWGGLKIFKLGNQFQTNFTGIISSIWRAFQTINLGKHHDHFKKTKILHLGELPKKEFNAVEYIDPPIWGPSSDWSPCVD